MQFFEQKGAEKLSVSGLALSGAPRQLSQRESQKAFFLTGFLHSRRKQGDSRRFY